ncbi:GDSL-type esterase/lipase family protein [Methylobacterium sp. J-030]|uniref:GDSL-type esterase/lipase family protein n=1 Tax=Methylobacterium sp. J-030 TaxID=2836627 RepID=UPI001FB9D1DA|nr:GDSL-type esterase/lipase family protein [Methylobacterium sp. J-030]MCJ2073111.1 GDSL-type esterase/lipase family protein [Methylobacterium sp. J-030]
MNLLRLIRASLKRGSLRAQRNLPVMGAAEPRGPILFMGDSITGLWGMHRTAQFIEHAFINRGIGGEMSGQVRARLAPAIAETQPTGVHILCGINDIAHRAAYGEDMDPRGNIAAMLAEARARGVRTWVGSLTPADWLIWGGIDPRDEITAMNAWLCDHAESMGAIYVDYHAVLATPSGSLLPEYSEDGLHLTPAGYAVMEPVLLAALQKQPHPPPWGTRPPRRSSGFG